MSRSCPCHEPHPRAHIVLTGGPGAGKTAVLELVRHHFCHHVHVLPESAGIVFGGGFPRTPHAAGQRAAQRAIFYVQRELENAADAENAAILICDRGTVDGAAYWPGPDTLWSGVGTTIEDQFARYQAVIHLRTPPPDEGYNHSNPLRIESARQAARIDARLLEAWRGHPRRFIVEPEADFLAKARRVIDILRGELPDCCRHHVVPEVDRL
ncbi:MAG TPA: ATP-binding protein [Vicinamibacterales bacterium]|nr:ATP-binding protein [Vicinamibacterales bacterium]